jgi:DNA-binding transcriptional ArsR family regulator
MTQTQAMDVCQVQCFNTELVSQSREALPGDEILEEAYTLFSAMADRSRLKILYTLCHDEKELCVCDVASLLGIKVAAASHHLRKLRDLKILKHRSDGKLVYYSLRDRRIASLLTHTLDQLAD